MLSEIVLTLLILLSLAVWVRIGLRINQGRPVLEAAPRNRSPWLHVACGTSAAFLVLMLAAKITSDLSGAEKAPLPDPGQLRWSVANGIGEVVVALAVLTAFGCVSLRDVGIHTDDLGRQSRDGVVGYLASLAPVFFIVFLTASLRTPDRQHPFLQLLETNPSQEIIALLMISAVVVAPIKEELLFRVMLQDGLARKIGSVPAIAIVSVLFSAVHGFPDSLALVPLAVILGYVYDRRQSVLSVVLIHALFNLTNILIMLLTPPEVPV